jgi:hypothetical protein
LCPTDEENPYFCETTGVCTQTEDDGLSTGVIIAIIAGCVVGLPLLIVLTIVLCKKCNKPENE